MAKHRPRRVTTPVWLFLTYILSSTDAILTSQFFSSPLDHFDAGNNGTFKQRYLVDDQYFVKGVLSSNILMTQT